MDYRKIFCVGWNYKAHVSETNAELPEEPIIFTKPLTSLIGDGDPILLPDLGRMDYEAEMAVILGKGGKFVSEEDALDHVSMLAPFNDVTARDVQSKSRNSGGPWALAKGMDTFAPMGDPVPLNKIDDLYDIDLEARINGERVQYGNTKQMIFSVEELISYISRFITLEKGDIIATGTPVGIDPIKPGDTVEVEVFGVGKVSNPVRSI
jgi:2-keto-4-pentenoate hydratase/2-oxohepta-3-ene-1,7-dioic acid hydratase in catechol pathway